MELLDRLLKATRHPLRWALTAAALWALLGDFSSGPGAITAQLAVPVALLIGELLGRSRIRGSAALGGLFVSALGSLALSWGLTSLPWLTAWVGPTAALSLSSVLSFGALSFWAIASLRVLGVRSVAWRVGELMVLAACVVGAFAAHRQGAIGRPIWLADLAWSMGVQPSAALLVIAGGLGAALAALMFLETKQRLPLVGALLIPAVALLMVFLGGRVSWTQPPEAQGSGRIQDELAEGGAEASSDGQPEGGGEEQRGGGAGEPEEGDGQADAGDEPEGGASEGEREGQPEAGGEGEAQPEEGGERGEGGQAEGEQPEGEQPEGEQPEGEQPEGEQPEGGQDQGDQPQGDQPQGDQPQGDQPQGDQPQGDQPQGAGGGQGEAPEGQQGQGERPQGQGSEGGEPSGDGVADGGEPAEGEGGGGRPESEGEQGGEAQAEQDPPEASEGGGEPSEAPSSGGQGEQEGEASAQGEGEGEAGASSGEGEGEGSGSKPSNPVAVVLLDNDHVPPAEVWYLRQDTWSKHSGQRLLPPSREDIDRDVLRRFPTEPLTLEWPPPEDGRVPVRAEVALLIEHTAPFSLDSPLLIEPIENPNRGRFVRAYAFEALAWEGEMQSLIGLEAGDPDWSEAQRAHYTEPPEDTRYAALAEEMVAALPETAAEDPFAQALSMKLWLDERMTYSTAAKHAGVDDPTADFLFGDLTGYCTHAAHALTYLMRTRGLPARVAGGYAVEETERRGSTLLVRDHQAHAWAELYLDGRGWVPIDVSPATNLDPPTEPLDEQMVEQLTAMARGETPDEGEDESEESDEAEGGLSMPDLSWVWPSLRALLLGTLRLLLALLLPAHWLVKLWRRAIPRFASHKKTSRLAYRAALDRLVEQGHRRGEGETRERFARRMSPISPTLQQMTALHMRAALGDPKAPPPLKRDLLALNEDVAREVYAATPRWRWVLGVVNPFSIYGRR